MAAPSATLRPRARNRSPGAGLEAMGSRLLGRRIYATLGVTLKAALRYRLVQVMLGLLLLAVAGLPAIVKHDGTAQGFTQILLTYTLGSITMLLGFATLWLGCGTLARDVEECQMQLIVAKPIARWEVWLGKWLGIMVLNTGLLAVAGAVVFGLLQWRASRLPNELQQQLRSEVLVARGSVRETIDRGAMQREVERQLQERLKESNVAAMDRTFVRTQIVERVKAQFQIVPPGTVRRWRMEFGARAAALRDQPLFFRSMFFAAQASASGTFGGFWEIGPPNGRRYRPEAMSLSPETFHEFAIPSGLIGDDGILTIDFINLNETALLFPLDNGLEVLFPEASFGLNFVRGLAIILCWLGLLAAIGLAAGSFLSFPVAAFCALGILAVGFSTGTLKQVIEEGGVTPVDRNTGLIENPTALDRASVVVFKSLLWTINLARDFSPIDSMSTGRSIGWSQVAQAVAQILLLMSGLFASVGIWVFTRRELARAQNA